MRYVSRIKLFVLVVSIGLLCLPQLGFAQELYAVLEAWEKQETEFVNSNYSMEFLVVAENSYQVNTGRHYFCRKNSGEMSWYTGADPSSAKFARCINSDYSFTLSRSGEKPLKIVGFQFAGGGDSSLTETSLQYPTCGASRGFTFVPSMDMTLGGLNEARDFLVQESISSTDGNRTAIEFSVNRDKGIKIATDPIAPKSKALMTILGRGLRKGVIVVDSESKRIVGLKAEFEFHREPITEKVIQACNNAGQRRADGSLFPLEDAEPEGEMILAKQRLDCRWKYEKGQLLEFEIIDSSEGEFSTALTPYQVREIKYIEKEQADQLSDYGFREPKTGKSPISGDELKTGESSSLVLPARASDKSGAIFGFQIAMFSLGALALLFSIVIRSSAKTAALLFLGVVFLQAEQKELLGQDAELSSGFVTELMSEKLIDSNYFCNEVELVDFQKEKLRKVLIWLEGKMGQVVSSHSKQQNTSAAEQFEDIRKQTAKKLDEFLVADQKNLMQALVGQRAMIKQQELEAFELPKVVSNGEESLFAKQELSRIATACDKAKQDYSDAVLESMRESLRMITSEFPDEFVNNFELVFQAVSQKSDLFQSEYSFEILDNTLPDNDFDEFENLCFHNLVTGSISSKNTRDLLGVQEYQTEEFRKLVSLPHHTPAKLIEKREEFNRSKMAAVRKGDIKELKILFQKDIRLTVEEREAQVRDILEQVFVPHQITNIEKIAKFKRLQLEFGRNPFDSFASWAKLQDLPAKKIRGISEKSEAAAKEFEKQRKREWDLACKAVEASMSTESLARFRKRFGPFYDLTAELVENSDKGQSVSAK